MKWRVIFVCLAIAHILYADVEISDIEIKQGVDRVEVILNMRGVYEKSPHLTMQEGYKGVVFPQLQANARNQSFSGFFIKEVQVFNVQGSLYVIGVGDVKIIDVQLSKAPYAFKIVFIKVAPPQSEIDILLQTPHKIPNIDIITSPPSTAPTPKPIEQNTQSNDILSSVLPFKEDMNIDTWRYMAVLGVMAFLVIVLWIVKRYVVRKKPFKSYLASISQTKPELFDPTKIEVVSRKDIDSKHKILTLESNGYRYLILIGATSTTLIDRYPIPQNITLEEQLRFDDQFAKLLEQKQERLSKYLHTQ
ncbi:flagellar biosynthetic protein FliO [Helicobacter typhlonius]|uniref:Predicted membrane-associated n=1 Tax=Helicobacter typhlonius TaxID=76936 RepID=A0A0S4PUG0_9HELI|nr:flagellar biosynthetic protein FliO [Helicobacter typhlonius]TLD79502.1 hypothetical protein LS75_000750 [Helicobacter typhlonius]CUU39382.1 predicted membrane-associated [Helicobacter typhlonius]